MRNELVCVNSLRLNIGVEIDTLVGVQWNPIAD